MPPANKLSRLKKIILDMDSLLVAFSGGTDSTFLLKVASGLLPKGKLLAVTAQSETYPDEELFRARVSARRLGVAHKVIRTYELSDRQFRANPAERCYFCKKELFAKLIKIAARSRLKFVADASNISDQADFRPGSRAKEELGVRSPLQEAGLSKDDIRKFSREMKLPTWDKPSLACLASRIPYGTRITTGLLSRINQGEEFLRGMGFRQVRLRHYGRLCRIEVEKKELKKIIEKSPLVSKGLKNIGYDYVTLDLEGYRTGSLNEVLK